MHDLITPDPFPEDILRKANKMRESIPVPECLDSPFYLARLLRACGGDEKLARKRAEEIFSHRELLGYARCSNLEIYTEFPISKATLERFRVSLLGESPRCGDVFVTIQKMEGCDLREIMKVIPLSHVLHTYYMIHEVTSRILAETEKKTGRPCSVVAIIDLKGLRFSDFLNPLSTCSQLAHHVTKIWSEYFRDNICKMVLINPPAVLSFVVKMTSLILDTKTFSHMMFLDDVSDLQKYLEPHTIPVEYGGTRRDDSGHSEHPESCVLPYKPVTSAEYRGVDDVWSDHGFSKPPPSETFTMKSHQPVELVRECNRAGKLVWSFMITGDVEFEIVRREIENDVKVWPKIVLTSLKLPEYGSIPTVPGKYVLRFDNPSTTLFSVKVKGAAEIKTSAE